MGCHTLTYARHGKMTKRDGRRERRRTVPKKRDEVHFSAFFPLLFRGSPAVNANSVLPMASPSPRTARWPPSRSKGCGVELIIDCEGVSLPSWDISIDEAVWNHGFIHMRFVRKSLIMSVCPARVLRVTEAGAYYAIADFDPSCVFLRTDPDGACVVFQGYTPAINRIYALKVAAGVEKFRPDYSPQGTISSAGVVRVV